MGARVVQIPITTFSELRNSAADACTGDWIISLDSDERCTPELRDEILALLAAGPKYDAYYIPRRNFFMGRWIKGSGWYPNYRQPQFYRKGTMRYTRIIHEAVVMKDGQPIGKLENAIVQFPFQNFEEVLGKANRYSTFGARMLAHKTSVAVVCARPRDLGFPEALYFQARFHRRLGRLHHRVGEFRRDLLALCEAL